MALLPTPRQQQSPTPVFWSRAQGRLVFRLRVLLHLQGPGHHGRLPPSLPVKLLVNHPVEDGLRQSEIITPTAPDVLLIGKFCLEPVECSRPEPRNREVIEMSRHDRECKSTICRMKIWIRLCLRLK